MSLVQLLMESHFSLNARPPAPERERWEAIQDAVRKGDVRAVLDLMGVKPCLEHSWPCHDHVAHEVVSVDEPGDYIVVRVEGNTDA